MRCRPCALTLVLLIAATAADAERPPVRTHGLAQGLPSTFVDHILSDSRGLLWFSPRDGLARFDGSRFVTIRGVLKDYDTFFFYSAARRPASLTAVWVYPRGAAALRPVPLDAWASTQDLDAAVSDPDSPIREEAYEALICRPDRASRVPPAAGDLRGASETDAELRQRLLASAVSKGIEVPHDMVADLVRADGTEGIRVIALDALADDPAVRDVAVAALTDPSDVVRERATLLLAELDRLPLKKDRTRY